MVPIVKEPLRTSVDNYLGVCIYIYIYLFIYLFIHVFVYLNHIYIYICTQGTLSLVHPMFGDVDYGPLEETIVGLRHSCQLWLYVWCCRSPLGYMQRI